MRLSFYSINAKCYLIPTNIMYKEVKILIFSKSTNNRYLEGKICKERGIDKKKNLIANFKENDYNTTPSTCPM